MTGDAAVSDRVIRVMTDDDAFRVMAARTTDLVRCVVDAQGVQGAAAAQLGEVITSAVLIRETMAPANRVQVSLRDADGSHLVGDTHPGGRTGGLARLRDDVLGLRTDAPVLLRVERMLQPGKAHQGTVEVDLSGGVSAPLVQYFAQSEQITTMVGLGCASDGEQLAAGGFIVQLLPEVTEPPLAAMTDRVRAVGDVSARLASSDADPELLLAELMTGSEFTRLAETAVEFGCNCDESRALRSIAALGVDEIRKMIDVGQPVKTTCEFCRAVYEVGVDRLRRVLDELE